MSNDERVLRPSDDSPYWRGAVRWVRQEQWWKPWRLLPEYAARAHAPQLLEMAQMPAGVRAQMRTDAEAVCLPMEYNYDVDGHLDVTVDGELHSRIELTPGATQVEVALPGGTHDVQVWLPQVGTNRVGPLELPGATVIEPVPAGPRWSTYGSSITMCSAAYGPSQTWPALVARELGWDLTCMGYSGQCHLDPIAARTIAATPADVISLCLGINIYGSSTFNERSFAPQVSGFIEQVREAHPGVPIVVMTPIASPARETTPNEAGMTLQQMRRDITEVVHTVQAADDGVHLIDGLQVLAIEEADLMPDGLHPDGQGYELMARRLAPALAALPPA